MQEKKREKKKNFKKDFKKNVCFSWKHALLATRLSNIKNNNGIMIWYMLCLLTKIKLHFIYEWLLCFASQIVHLCTILHRFVKSAELGVRIEYE